MLDRQDPRDAARGHAAAGNLPLHARHDARADDPAHAAGAAHACVQEVWERRMPDLPIQSPEQLVMLASIIEKETGKPDERTRVAAVFVNRLKQKMKLQSDPTIIYGLVGGKGTLGRADPAQRDRAADAVQHLCDRRPAAGTDRQSGPRLARGRRQSGAHQGTVLRRRRHRRPRLRRQLRAASEERRAAARARAAGATRSAAATPASAPRRAPAPGRATRQSRLPRGSASRPADRLARRSAQRIAGARHRAGAKRGLRLCADHALSSRRHFHDTDSRTRWRCRA